MTITLRTLGTGTVAPHPERVSAGHLVRAGSTTLLMDAGSGVVHRLAQHAAAEWPTLDVLLLSHFHLDHVGDVPALFYGSKYGLLSPRSEPLVIVGPAGTRALLERLAAAFGPWVLDPGFPLDIRELAPEARLEIGDGVEVESRKVPHTEESVAYSIVCGGRRLVYTGDTGWDASLGEWATGADLLLAECSLPASMAIPGHLTPEECGALARLARPRRLALTHFYPPVEQVDVAALVGERWDGALTVARDGMLFSLEDD